MDINNRWLEIKFYMVCLDIMQIRNNLLDVMDFIDGLSFFGFSPEQIKPLAQEALSSIYFRPSKEEFCILAYINKVGFREIQKRTKLHNNTIYRILSQEKQDPRIFFSRFEEDKHPLIAEFLDIIYKIKGVGVPC